MAIGTNNAATREVRQFWAWRYDAEGYNKTSVGPVWGKDAIDAAGEARRLHGPGRYQIRQAVASGRIAAKYC